jgi:hypothetical protein
MSDTTHKPVVFLNSLGEEISNDPVWHAQQTLAQYGQPFAGSQPNDLVRTLEKAAAPEDDEDLDDDDTTPPVDAEGIRTYKELNQTQLKAEAKERQIDISSAKKVGDIREALRQADIAAKADDSDEE